MLCHLMPYVTDVCNCYMLHSCCDIFEVHLLAGEVASVRAEAQRIGVRGNVDAMKVTEKFEAKFISFSQHYVYICILYIVFIGFFIGDIFEVELLS